MGPIKTKRLLVHTKIQPKHIVYPIDSELLYKVKRKLGAKVEAIRSEITFRKFFQSISSTSSKVHLQAKKLFRQKPLVQQEALSKLSRMLQKVLRQASGMIKSLYAMGRKGLGRELHGIQRLGRKGLAQARTALKGFVAINFCVVGSGYVGLVTGACFAKFGVSFTCVDKPVMGELPH